MSKVIVAIVVLSIILTAGIVECVMVEKVFSELDEKLQEIKVLLTDENIPTALLKTNDTIAWWERKREKLELFSFSPDLRLMSVTLGETKGSLESDDIKNAMSKIESIFSISHNLRDNLNFNLQDII